MDRNWYYLDPDNNKDDPSGLHCARCKRKLKETQVKESFISIELHPIHPWFRKAIATKPIPSHLAALIGNDCFEKVIKEYGIMEESTQSI